VSRENKVAGEVRKGNQECKCRKKYSETGEGGAKRYRLLVRK